MNMKMWKKILGSVILTTVLIVLSGCTDKIDIVLKNNEITVEYGEKLKEAKEYLDSEKMSEEDINKVEMDSSQIKNEENKDYLAVGEYTVSFTAGDEKAEMKVTVKDTTAPVFKEFKDNLETENGKKISEDVMKKSFVAEDLSNVEIKTDDSKVDYAKAGEYKMTVTAEDEHGNKTEKECTVKVKEKKTESTSTTSKNTGTENTASSSSSKMNSSSSSKTSSSSQSTSSSSSKPSGNSSSAKPSNNTQKPDEKPTQSVVHKHSREGFEGKWFNSGDELDSWVMDYLIKHDGGPTYSGYQCSCGKWCIDYIEGVYGN